MTANGWRHLVLAMLGLVTALSLGARSLATLAALLAGRETIRAPFVLEAAGPRVLSVRPAAVAAGLQAGDRVLAIGDAPYLGRKVLSRALAARSSQPLLLTVVREEPAGPGRLRLEVRPETGSPGSATDRALGLVLAVFLPLFCGLLGFAVALRRPEDGRAWLLLLLLLSFASIFSGDVDPLSWPAVLRFPTIVFLGLLNPTWGVFMLLFGIRFPEPAGFDRRWPWLKWVLVAPLVLYALLGTFVDLGASERFASVSGLAAALAPFARVATILGMLAVGGFFALMGQKSFRLPSPDARRRLRLLWAGATLSLTPMFLVVTGSILRGRPVNDATPWLLVPALFALALFPLTLAYVIVVDRALDVGVVLRQGLQYALARNAVVLLQVAISAGVVFTALSLATEPGARRVERIGFMAAGVWVVVLIRTFAVRGRAFIDRRFFREALDTERLLTELGEDVRTIALTHTLLDTVVRRLTDALHVPRVAVFLKRESGHLLTQAVGLGEPLPELGLGEESAVVARLKQEGRPLTFYPEDIHHWSHAVPEREALAVLRTQLLIPLLLKERLLGFLSLGPKLSEEAYSPSDLRLLRSVGAQVALALENTRLTEAVATEVAKRERMNRELEIAREVQERLFPQELPEVPGFEYAGYCRPARGVGGDYYDFLALGQSRLGLAIGDVSGKGIPAALLMASLQASLRGQVSFGPADLAEVMRRVNHLICDASSANRYATFFYAQFDPQVRTLAYVNAGHNAPMLLRAGGKLERLDQGGPVVGLIEVAGYQAAEVRLAPGDRLLAYTDGLSEAMNPREEEWGEERLLQAFRDCDGLSAGETIRHLIAAADGFAADAPQYDDMTVLVARLLA